MAAVAAAAGWRRPGGWRWLSLPAAGGESLLHRRSVRLAGWLLWRGGSASQLRLLAVAII